MSVFIQRIYILYVKWSTYRTPLTLVLSPSLYMQRVLLFVTYKAVYICKSLPYNVENAPGVKLHIL